jgi:hypothetical protein
MRRILFLACFLASACGPSLKEVRAYVARSPHRAIALYPLDRQGGEKDPTAQLGSQLEGGLRNCGFSVTGRGKTAVVYSSSTLRGRAFSETAQAVQLAGSWKVGAVLVGEVRGAYERTERTPEDDRFDPVPPPACCANAKNPCASRDQYDALLKAYVPQCSGWHRKVVVMRARVERVAGMTVRLRLVDAAAQKILWETSYEVPRESGTLNQLAGRVAGVLVDQLSQAYMKQLL